MDAMTSRFAKVWFREQCAVIADPGPYGGTGSETPFMGWVTQSTRTESGTTAEVQVTDTVLRCPIGTVVAVGDQIRLPEPYAGKWEVEAITTSAGAGLALIEHKKLVLKPRVESGGGPYG